MKNTINIVFAIAIMISISSCKKSYELNITGRVLDIATNEPIEGVTVRAVDGYWSGGGFLGGFYEEGEQIVYTDENGEFTLNFEGEHTCQIYLTKQINMSKWYSPAQATTYAKTFEASRFNNNYDEELTLYLQTNSKFQRYFIKEEPCNETDSLIVSYLPYNKAYLFEPEVRKFSGCIPHLFVQYHTVGGLYYHYKMDYTENGAWKSKTDSVFIEPFESYLDTIYY